MCDGCRNRVSPLSAPRFWLACASPQKTPLLLPPCHSANQKATPIDYRPIIESRYIADDSRDRHVQARKHRRKKEKSMSVSSKVKSCYRKSKQTKRVQMTECAGNPQK